MSVSVTGKSAAQKLSEVREAMAEAGADIHIITRVDDIAWLLNMRADDIPCFPVALCYILIDQQDAVLYINDARLSDDLKTTFAQIGVRTAAYDAIYEEVKHIPASSKVLLDKANTNYRITASLPQDVTIIDRPNPIVLMKAKKNPVELENIRRCHIRDAVAMTRFMYWLKTHVGKEKITESASISYFPAGTRAFHRTIRLLLRTSDTRP
ncbi:MAG: aminopeptidase P family N-terminal domain-containing protein [Merdibacter sp.]